MHKTPIPFLIAISVSACSPLPRQAERLVARESCCKSAADFKYLGIESAKPIKINIKEDTDAFVFPEGKSYFVALRLPLAGTPRKILLKTHRTGLLVDDSQIFCPAITYLDSKFESITNTGELPLSYQPPGLITSGLWYSVVDTPPAASYAVIHTLEKSIGRQIPLSGNSPGYAFFTGSSYIYVPGGPSTQKYPCGQTGEIAIEIRG